MFLFLKLISRTTSQIASGIANIFTSLGLFFWDFSLTFCNLILPKRPLGKLIPEGNYGFGGKWPPYVPPTETDSRSCCPALNALANHGILPHDGRNISYPEMQDIIRKVYNFSPTFCYYVPHYTATMLSRDYNKDLIDLSDINVHNGIEHDASLTRHDIVWQVDQGKPAQDLIDELLASATGDGGKILTIDDLARVSTKRRRESKAKNGQFTLSEFHKIFGSSNSSTLLTIFGGIIDDLKIFLKEERIPDGWESRIRKPYGLTISSFNSTVLTLETSIKDVYVPRDKTA